MPGRARCQPSGRLLPAASSPHPRPERARGRAQRSGPVAQCREEEAGRGAGLSLPSRRVRAHPPQTQISSPTTTPGQVPQPCRLRAGSRLPARRSPGVASLHRIPGMRRLPRAAARAPAPRVQPSHSSPRRRRCPGLQNLGQGRRDGGSGSLRETSAAADRGGGGAAATASGPGSALGGLGPDPARPFPGNTLFSRAAQPGGGEAGRRIITPRCNPQSWPNPKAQVPVSKTSGKVIETDKYGVTNNQ